MITFENIHKSFRRLKVLNGIDFSIGEGKVVGMLGPNGSGKSTMIKCMLNLVRPSSGTIMVNGIPSRDVKAREAISYMPQVARFAENISARQLIRLIGNLRNDHANPADLIEYFELGDHMQKPLSELSGGTRQKVSAVLAFLFESPIIVLDEPTVGLDPVARVALKDLVLQEKAKGKTIFFTSHIMSDIEEVAEDIAFLLEGKIVFHGNPNTLMQQTGQPTLEKAIAQFQRSSHHGNN